MRRFELEGDVAMRAMTVGLTDLAQVKERLRKARSQSCVRIRNEAPSVSPLRIALKLLLRFRGGA